VEFAVGRVAKLWRCEAPERPQRFTKRDRFWPTFGVLGAIRRRAVGNVLFD